MSSSDHGRPGRRRAAGRAVLFGLAAAFALSACMVQPVYGPATGGGSVTAALRGVVIDPVDDRVAQVVRNKLIFGLDASASDAVYRMHLTVSVTELALGINAVGSSPTYSVTVAVTYEVTRIGSKDVVAKNTSRASASYDRVNQAFANVRAKIDAENRAAAAVADDIRIRVATALAARA